jgi:hypothetical protein
MSTMIYLGGAFGCFREHQIEVSIQHFIKKSMDCYHTPSKKYGPLKYANDELLQFFRLVLIPL